MNCKTCKEETNMTIADYCEVCYMKTTTFDYRAKCGKCGILLGFYSDIINPYDEYSVSPNVRFRCKEHRK